MARREPAPRATEPPPHGSPPPKAAKSARLLSVDWLRGLVIALMVLDHVRDFFSHPAISPTDLTETTPALFMTRWITHYCAPVFVFLAGTSARLSAARKARPALSRFLLTRGLWLIVLEFSVVNFAWHFNFEYRMGLILQVIWAIGCSMCALSALVWLPRWAIASLSLVMVAGHNALDAVEPRSLGALGPLWTVLHVQAKLPGAFVVYPLVPWIAVMALGYLFGDLYRLDAARRRRLALHLGLAATLAFALLRAINGYGDPRPWSVQPSAVFTVLSFLNVTKYPPSLLYLLMTLGPALMALSLLEGVKLRPTSPLVVFGRVPLFAYVVHIALAHLLAGLLGLALGFGTAILGQFPFGYPDHWGFDLPAVYGAWLCVLLLLYPASRWFGALKAERRSPWLAYL